MDAFPEAQAARQATPLMKDAADLERLPNACYEPDYAAGIDREEALAVG